MSEELFDFPAGKRTRHSNRAVIKVWRAEHDIFTDHSGGCAWLAFSFRECKERLKGYNLSDDEKRDPISLFAGYCRLMDEAGLTAEAETEYEAVKAIAERLEKK